MHRLRMDRVIIAIIIFIILVLNIFILLFNFELRRVNNKNEIKEINVIGSGYEIIKELKDNGLIRNELASKIYLKLKGYNLQAGTYEFSTSMSTKEILRNIKDGKVTDKYNVKITFKEGKNIIWYAKEIDKSTNNSIDDVYNLLSDNEYINSLIDKYWFLTDDIKRDGIYYPLEGYLYPETYIFDNKDVSVKEIFNSMLNETEKVLNKYKDEIEKRNLNIHEFMTLASIVELEGLYKDDRDTIAGVFYNRLNSGWSLGSDVTTYYAVKKDMGEYPVLTWDDIMTNSPYNTRLSSMAGKLPIGPIGNPSITSIVSCINPNMTDYYYFVADCKTGKTVFSKTEYEHVQAVNKIKASGCVF